MEVNGVGNSLSDVEGGGEVVNRNKKKKENSYTTIKRGL
jgi:hypothetical protein